MSKQERTSVRVLGRKFLFRAVDAHTEIQDLWYRYLPIKDGCIDQVNFELEGCINTNACCNWLANLVEGKRVGQCWEISPDDIIDLLETLPPDHHHCAELTVSSFYLALADYIAGKG